MITECSMSDNLAVENPAVDFVRPCNLCPHMKRITLPGILRALETLEHRGGGGAEVAERARRRWSGCLPWGGVRAGEGAGRSAADRVRILASEGPERIRELERLGARFDRAPDGTLALGLEGAHSRNRIVHALGDRTGWEVSRVLAEAVLGTPGIRIVEGTAVTDLVVDAGVVRGARGVGPDGEAVTLRAPLVLLATGGAAHLYLKTTVPASARGDGLAMAARAGARLDGLEFVQFHPTALDVDDDPLPLVTEALRGEGARLVDARGRPIWEGIEGPGRGGLAPRHEVALRIHERIASGERVFLDARPVLGARFPERFPGVARACLERGIDPVREPIPVTPAAHYHMGGIAVDPDGRSTVPGLRAAGEVASTGVHGANRLASNSLLEGLVYGRRAGLAARADLPGGSWAASAASARAPEPRTWAPTDPVPAAIREAAGAPRDPAAAFRRLRRILWEGVGLVRDDGGLRRALRELEALALEGHPELLNPLLVARGITEAALARPRSLGSHLRSDEPSLRASAEPARRVS
jgi:L-aspartate oxidase